MATKPTLNDARWAELVDGTPASNLAAPTEGKKDTGFGSTAEALAGSLLNYIFRQLYLWAKYLDAPDSLQANQDADDPPALYGTNTTGTGVRGDTASDITTKAGVKGVSTGDAPAVLAINSSGGPALLVEGPAEFDDEVALPSLALSSNPTVSTAINNELHAKNVLKAFALIQTDGVGGVSVIDGMNISGVSISGLSVRVTFAHAMLNTNYAPALTGWTNGTTHLVVQPGINAQNAAYLDVGLGFLGAGVGAGAPLQDPALAAFKFTVHVFGAQ